MVCYIDTVSIYQDFTTTLTIDNSNGKWKVIRKPDKADTHFFIRYKGISCLYYPNRYGVGQFWITFSIGKLLSGSNLRPLNMLHLDKVLYQTVGSILMDIVKLPDYDISTWEVSRADLFLLHRIDPKQRQWYMQAYSHLTLGAYVPCQYENTFYLNSVLKRHTAAGTVVRIYPKLKEMQDTSPKAVEQEFECYMKLCDQLHDFIRLEFQFRRRVLRYFFHNAKSVTLRDILQEDFQRDRINRMIERLGLNRLIISRKHMQQQLDTLFTKTPTRQRAKQYIMLVNGRGSYPATIRNIFSAGQVQYIRQKLHQHGLHTIVSEFEDLEPVELLK